MVVERFDATIQVEENGWIDVREEIQVRFTGSWNGIFRNIPVEYRTPQGFSYKLWLDDVSVTGMDAVPLEYWNKRERHYRQLKIRVPGANDAVRTVVIRYRVPQMASSIGTSTRNSIGMSPGTNGTSQSRRRRPLFCFRKGWMAFARRRGPVDTARRRTKRVSQK